MSGGDSRANDMRPTHQAAVVPCWVLTRLPILAIALGAIPYRWPQIIRADIRLYEGWAAVLRQGRFPTGDWNWQYPPGPALAMLLPEWLPGGYLGGFLTLAALADAAPRRSPAPSSRSGSPCCCPVR